MGIEDKLNQAKGALKEGAGKLTGDKKTEIEGAVEKVVAKAKDGLEDVKEGVEGAVEGLKNNFKIIRQRSFHHLKRTSFFLI
ncbi:MAG: CsbD family protein [Streptococcus salivarius]